MFLVFGAVLIQHLNPLEHCVEGGSFQLVETLNGPGLVNHTIIDRETDIESITETTSTFTQ